jgi:hypothetical protein
VQNFPIVIKMIGGQVSLMYTPPGGGSTIIWRHALQAETWHHYVLGIKTSNALRGGTIELWFDGMKQMPGGSEKYAARTWDSGNHNCPKWGVYGGRGTAMTNFVADQRVATTYEEVAMGSPRPIPGPGATSDGGSGEVADAGTDATASPTAVPADAGSASSPPDAARSVSPARPDSAAPPRADEEDPVAGPAPSSARSGGCALAGDRPAGDLGWILGLLALALLRRGAIVRFHRTIMCRGSGLSRSGAAGIGYSHEAFLEGLVPLPLEQPVAVRVHPAVRHLRGRGRRSGAAARLRSRRQIQRQLHRGHRRRRRDRWHGWGHGQRGNRRRA